MDDINEQQLIIKLHHMKSNFDNNKDFQMLLSQLKMILNMRDESTEEELIQTIQTIKQ